MAPYTVETFWDKQVTVRQFVHGYRFSLDPIVLAAHIVPASGSRILDVGCGCGIISILLASQYQNVQIFGVEIQRGLADLAQDNVMENGLGDRVNILHGDIVNFSCEALGGTLDMVVANPPYKKRGTGRISKDQSNALARHEISMNIRILCGKAGELTGQEGALALIFPADRFHELKMAMTEAGFCVDRIRCIYTGKGRNPKLVMVSGRKSMEKEPEILPPFYILDPGGQPSAEYNEVLFHGRARHRI